MKYHCTLGSFILSLRKRQCNLGVHLILRLRKVKTCFASKPEAQKRSMQSKYASDLELKKKGCLSTMKHTSAIVVDDSGRHVRDAKTNRAKNWKCSSECKLPTALEIECY